MATAQQLQRRNENAAYLRNANVRAALEMISKSEGTKGDYQRMVFGVVTKSPLFPSLVGKKDVRIPDLSRFPQIMVRVNNKGLNSSAAGKYQIIRKTYEAAARTMGITDFSPTSQDLLAVELMRQRGALPYIMRADIEGALTKTSLPKEWASFAGAGYGQGEHSISKLVGWFRGALGTASKFVAENPGEVAGGSAVVLLLFGAAVFF